MSTKVYIPEPLTSRHPILRYNSFFGTKLPVPTGEKKLLKGIQNTCNFEGKSGSNKGLYRLHIYINKPALTEQGYYYLTKDIIAACCRLRNISIHRRLPYLPPNALYYIRLPQATLCKSCMLLMTLKPRLYVVME